MNKFILSLIFLTSLILASAMVSAQLVIYSPTNASVSDLNQNLNATGTFILGNINATSNATGIAYSITSSTLTFSLKGTNGPAQVNSFTNQTVNYWVTVPQYTVPGNYNIAINASGTLDGGVPTSDTKTVIVIVNPSPSLSLAWITAPASVYQKDNISAVVNLTNTGNIALNVNMTASFGNLTWKASTISLAPGQSAPVSININTTSKTAVGEDTFTAMASGYSGSSSFSTSLSQSINIKYNYCRVNSTAYPVYIEEIVNIDDIHDETFKPLDVIKLKVKVGNTDSESKRVKVEARLVRSAEVSSSESQDSQKISADSTKTFNLNLTIPADVSKGTYYIFVKAYDDNKESNCEQEQLRIYVDRDDREILINDVSASIPSIAQCGDSIEVKGSLVNLGAEYEEKIMLNYSDDFGSKDSVIFDSVDSGDIRDFLFTLSIPKNATEKIYRLKLTSYYEYNSDDDTYDNSWGESYSFIVSGNCLKDIKNSSVSVLTQTAFLAKDSDVTLTVSNTGNVQTTYTVNASSADFNIKSISPSTITLPAGSIASVTVKVSPKSGVEAGMHNLEVGISYPGHTETKTISLNVQNPSVISGWYTSVKNAANQISWMIVIDVVLALAIVILVIKLFTAKAATAAVVSKVGANYKNNIRKNFK